MLVVVFAPIFLCVIEYLGKNLCSAALRFFARTSSIICRIIRICVIVERFFESHPEFFKEFFRFWVG